MRLLSLSVMVLVLSGCAASLPTTPQEKVESSVSSLFALYAQGRVDRLADYVHSDFGWNGCDKDCLLLLVEQSRDEKVSVEIGSLVVESDEMFQGMWKAEGTVVFESQYVGVSSPQKDFRSFEWLLKQNGSRYQLWGVGDGVGLSSYEGVP